jgi:hypothetical protein
MQITIGDLFHNAMIERDLVLHHIGFIVRSIQYVKSF